MNSMRWRSLISVPLILVLLPAWSFVAGCDFYCRAADTSTNPAAHTPHAAHPTIQHHHHAFGMVNVAAEAQGQWVATHHQQGLHDKTCCKSKGPSSSMSCAAPPESALQEYRFAPKCNDNSAVTQSRLAVFVSVEQDRSRLSSTDFERSAGFSPSLILRI
jgi:hypothetical protein